MERDGEPIVVDAPQLLKNHLGLAAGVDEDERGLVAPDQRVDLAERMARGVAGPRQPLRGVEHAHVGPGAALRDHEIGERRCTLRLWHQEAPQIVGLRHGG